MYLGAKHMVTGHDHILFLFGVIFFLYKLKHVGLYVSLFALGHSTTMLLGVYFNVGINSYMIDAIIGFSIVYKALDNLGAFQRWLGVQPRSEEHTSELQSLMRISYAVFCLTKKTLAARQAPPT